MDRKTNINIVMSLLLQTVTIISGFIIPRQILNYFGSDVNGLISSITQFLNYISLIEGGIGSVILTSLYSPINKKDNKAISGVVVAANNFFRKIAKIFLVYLIIISLVYPYIGNTGFSRKYVTSLTLILGISLFIQYYFSITWRLLLQADRKVYISSGIQIIVVIVNTLLTVIVLKLYPSIHLVKLIASLSFVVQPIIYELYIKKYYSLDLTIEPDKLSIQNRWDGFGINLAAFLNGNTDVIVLTLFSSLSNVSIYSVYNLVVAGIKSIITSISAGITPSLGKYYACDDKKELGNTFEHYENIIFYFSFSVYGCALALIVPFVLNYVNGIKDANYEQPVFSALLILSALIFCLREPYVNMSYVAGAYRTMSVYAYIEALINITLSVVFVYKFGINGVAFGTLISMSFRTFVQVYYLKYKVLYRNCWIFVKKFVAFSISTMLGLLIAKLLFDSINAIGWTVWIIRSVEVAIILFSINYITLNMIKVFVDNSDEKNIK